MSWTKSWESRLLTVIVLLLTVEVIRAQVDVKPGVRLGIAERVRRSPKWSSGSSRSSATSKPSSGRATSAPNRATSAPVRATAGFQRATTAAAPVRRTTSGFQRPTTAGYHIIRTTTAGPRYPTQQPWYPLITHTTPRPIYPVLPHPPPIYVPPPPPAPVPQPPTIIIIKDSTPSPPKNSFLFLGGSISSGHQSHHFATPKTTTRRPTTTSTTSTTTTRTPKTTTEIPWKEVVGGLELKAWHDFVKSTQRKDIPLSGQWVRIRGGPSMREGYVEIVGEGGQWGSVCDEPGSWDLQKASIVCRQLGFNRGAEAAWQGRPTSNVIIPTAQVRKVSCSEQAQTLLHCNLRRSKDSNFPDVDVNQTCHGNTRNVGVRCRPEPNTVCKFGERPFGKSCYRVVLPPTVSSPNELAKIGTDAVATCRKSRAELVSVTTQAENDFISDWLQTEYPAIDRVLTSGFGTHARLAGIKGPLEEWWLWQGQFKNIDYERWWPGWTSQPTITPIVPPKGTLCLVLENKFPIADTTIALPPQPAGYFYWKAYDAVSKWNPMPFICEREASDVGCLRSNEEYMGPANISTSGKVCLSWDMPEIRHSTILNMSYLYNPFVRERVLSGHNACRRVNLNAEPWCFVSPGAGLPPQPELCDIPICGKPSDIASYYAIATKTNIGNYYAPNFVPFNLPSGYGLPQTYSAHDTRPSVTFVSANSVLPAVNAVPKEPHLDDLVKTLSLNTYELPRMLTETIKYESPNLRSVSEVSNNTESSEESVDSFRTLTTERLAEAEKETSPGGNVTEPAPRYKLRFRPRIFMVEPIKEKDIRLENASSTTGSTDGEVTYPPLQVFTPSLYYPHPEESNSTGSVDEEVTYPPLQIFTPSLYYPHPEESNSTGSVNEEVTYPPLQIFTPSLYYPHPEESNSTGSVNEEVTYPPLQIFTPSLYYPHPEESEPTTTEEQITVTPKPKSLYAGHDRLPSRYAEGKGKLLARTLSSSDLFLILNGVLPYEHIKNFDASSEVFSTTGTPREEEPSTAAPTSFDSTTLPENEIPHQQNPDSSITSTNSTLEEDLVKNIIAVPADISTDSVLAGQNGQVDGNINEIEGHSTVSAGETTNLQPSSEPTLLSEPVTKSVQSANTDVTEGPSSTWVTLETISSTAPVAAG